MNDESHGPATGWNALGGVLAMAAVLAVGLLMVTRGSQGPAPAGAASLGFADEHPESRRDTAEQPVKIDLYEGGAHESAPPSPEATQGITSPNARQWLTQRYR